MSFSATTLATMMCRWSPSSFSNPKPYDFHNLRQYNSLSPRLRSILFLSLQNYGHSFTSPKILSSTHPLSTASPVTIFDVSQTTCSTPWTLSSQKSSLQGSCPQQRFPCSQPMPAYHWAQCPIRNLDVSHPTVTTEVGNYLHKDYGSQGLSP